MNGVPLPEKKRGKGKETLCGITLGNFEARAVMGKNENEEPRKIAWGVRREWKIRDRCDNYRWRKPRCSASYAEKREGRCFKLKGRNDGKSMPGKERTCHHGVDSNKGGGKGTCMQVEGGPGEL